MLKVHFNFKPFLLTLAISTLLLSSFLTYNTKAQAALGINRTINFQGKLVNNPSGTNVSNTSYTVIFTIYDNPSGATALWTETQTITTADGIFRASLGSVTPIPANFNFNWSDLYLGVKVNADSEMTPRVKLAAVPFAFNAERVSGLTVQDDAGNASTSGTLRVANSKTVTFAGSNGLTFNDPGGSTTITFPATGSLTLVDTATGQTLTNKIIGSTGLTFTGATTDITTGANEAFVIVPNGSGFIGINTTTPLASFDLRNNGILGGTVAIASVSGRTSFATMVINNDLEAGDLFTASSSSQSRFTIKGNGQIIANAYETCTLKTNSTGLFTCGTDGLGYAPLQELNGGIVTNNSTMDFLLGAQSSTSAKFRITGDSPFAGTLGVASVAGRTSFASLVVDNHGVGDLFTASRSGAPRFVISNQGYIGIGTVVPNTELEVVGDIVSVGTKFITRTSPADNSWNGVAYGNGLFVAVASSGTNNRVMTSPDGINWTTRSAPDHAWNAITYGNGLFAAVGSTSGVENQVMTSPDGITWTPRKSSANQSWTAVTYGNGLFVAVGGSGTTLMSSPDGINWTTRTAPSSQSWTAVTYGNGLFVAVAGSAPNTAVITSSNGISWALRTGVNNLWSGITYGNGLFAAVSSGGSTVQTSPDGITWSSPTVPAMANSLVAITYGDGLFVALSAGGATMTSHNGVNWTRRSVPTANAWSEIAFGNGMFVAVSSTGTNDRVMTSGKPQLNLIATDNVFQGGLNVFSGLNVGTISGLATFDVRGNNGTIAAASVSGRTSFAASVVNNDGVGDLFTASSSSQTRFTISNNGGVAMNGSLAVNGDLITADGATLTINAGGTVDIQDGLTVDSLTIDTGDITWSGSTPTITINAAETFTISNGTAADNFVYNTSTNALTLGDGTNGLTFDIDTGMAYQGTGRKVKKITLSAEYAGAVLTASGSATTNGSMTSDASPSGALSNYMNYYEWTSSQTSLQDYTVAIRVHLPEDFSAWATSTAAAQIKFNTETSINSLINKLDVMIYNTDNALSASDQATPVVFKGDNTSLSKNWKDIDILSTQLDSGAARDIDATGEVMVIYLKMSSKDNNHVQIGNIVLSYLSAF